MDIFTDLLNKIATGREDEDEEEDPEFIPTESPLSSEDEKEDNTVGREERLRQIAEDASARFKEMRNESLSSLKRQQEVFPSISKLPCAPPSMKSNCCNLQQYISRHQAGPDSENGRSLSEAINLEAETGADIIKSQNGYLEVNEKSVKDALASLKSGSESSLGVQRVRFAGKEYIMQVEAGGRRKRLPAASSSSTNDETTQIEKRLRENVEELTTLKKSRIDWDVAKSTAEDKHLLDQHAKGDSGFLSRARFLKKQSQPKSAG